MRILHIICSPRGKKSASFIVANTFLDAVAESFSDMRVDTLNVWDEKLPEFDSETIGAKYKRISKEPMNSTEQAAWGKIEALVKRFQAADRIVIGIPMWNFSYPYKLKQLVDLVSQRNMLFTFDGAQYGPMLKIPKALAIHVRGQSQISNFGGSSPGFEYQSNYINFWLKFIGVDEVFNINVEHTWDEGVDEHIDRAKDQAIMMAPNF